MRYRNQYISTFLSKENFDIPIPINSNISDNEMDKFMNNLDKNINSIYDRLIVDLSDLSKKIDKNFDKNENSINSLSERIYRLEKNGLDLQKMNFDPSIREESKNKFKNSLKNINLDIDSFLEEEMNSSFEEKRDFFKNDNSLFYNKNWEEDFNKKGLSLENDGIYEYEDGEEDMKYEYYNGELPKTKIVKVRANDGIQTYTKDDISSFIENESKKLALNEVSKLHNQSETTQKAWLANNQRLVELTNIIEAQEKEIRRLSQNVLNKSNINNEDVSNMINNNALKILKDEYESRLSALEKNLSPKDLKEDKNLYDEIKKQKEENEQLRRLLNNNTPSNQKVEVVVSAAPVVEKTKMFDRADIGRKKKQKYFFEIVEHSTPKITKADLDK